MEKSIEAKLKKKVERASGMCLKLFSPMFTGLPDRIVLLPPGKVAFVEVKMKGKKPTARQLFVHHALRRIGFAVFVLDDEADIDGIIESILQD